MADQNKVVLRRHFAEFWSWGNVTLVDELFASDCLGHASVHQITGREAVLQYVITVRTAFPNLEVKVEDQIAEGDKVVIRWTAHGTPMGVFVGRPPTGKQASVTGITIFRMANSKIVECWTDWDGLSTLQQLGLIRIPRQTRR